MRHLYRDDPLLCRAPLLGNGDLVFPLSAEGAIKESLPTPAGLPSSALYRLTRPTEGGVPMPYLYLAPTLTYLDRPLGAPFSVSTEFSTDEASFTSVCKYDRGVTVETRACAVYGKPLLMITKKLSAQGPVGISYDLTLPRASTLQLDAEAGMLLGERPLPTGRERLCFFATAPMHATLVGGGGRLSATLPKNATVTFYLFFAEAEGSDSLWTAMSDMQGYIYKKGDNRLYNEHVASWRTYREECELVPQNPLLARVTDGAQYWLRATSSAGRAPLTGNHPHAPFGYSPAVDLRVLSAYLHGGHFGAARRLLDAQLAALGAAEARFAGAGKPGARYPYYSDLLGGELLPDDIRRDRLTASADVAVGLMKYYRFTEDRAFLATAMPALRSTAAYLTARVGSGALSVPDPLSAEPSVRAPLLSTVAVASALSAYADAAELLSCDRTEGMAARRTAEALFASLTTRGGAYTLHADTDMPGRAPLYLYPYHAPLREEPLRKAIVLAGLSSSLVAPPPYDMALLGTSYAGLRTSALPTLMRLAATADEFGFFPDVGAEGLAELAAIFLDGVYRSFAAYAGGTIHLGFGLDADGVADCDFMLPLPMGARVDGRIRGGRFVSLRILRAPASRLRSADLAMPKWLYAPGAAVAVRQTERGGMMYMNTVVH